MCHCVWSTVTYFRIERVGVRRRTRRRRDWPPRQARVADRRKRDQSDGVPPIVAGRAKGKGPPTVLLGRSYSLWTCGYFVWLSRRIFAVLARIKGIDSFHRTHHPGVLHRHRCASRERDGRTNERRLRGTLHAACARARASGCRHVAGNPNCVFKFGSDAASARVSTSRREVIVDI